MRERLTTWAIAILIVAGISLAATFTDVDVAKYHGKTGLKALTTVIDANNALISGGTLDQTQVTLATGAIIKNPSASDVTVEYTNATAELGVIALDTSVLTGSVGDNSYYEWVLCRAPDSASNDTDYAAMRGYIDDETSGTEDGSVDLLVTTNGALKAVLTMDKDSLDPSVDNGIDLGSASAEYKDLYIDGTANVDALVYDSATLVAAGTTNRPIVGATAVAQQVIEVGTCTNGETVAYTTVYGTAPQIFLTYQEDAGADTVLEAVSITTTNFQVQGAAAKSIAWMSVGLK